MTLVFSNIDEVKAKAIKSKIPTQLTVGAEVIKVNIANTSYSENAI